MQNQIIFPFDLVELRAGKKCCPACGKPAKSFCKTLDDRLVELAYQAFEYALSTKNGEFRVEDAVTYTEKDPKKAYRKTCDFYKLTCWKIVERTKGGYWRFTQLGYRFLLGGESLPRKVWVFNKRVVEMSDETVTAESVRKRWQLGRGDYSADWIPAKYRTVIQANAQGALI